MLKFNNAWRFTSPGPISEKVSGEFFSLIGKVATQGDRQKILEHYKTFFASAAGTTSSWSSSPSWAEADLNSYMNAASQNAALFVEAFYDACVSLQVKHPDYAIPTSEMINDVLARYGANLSIRLSVQGRELISQNSLSPVEVPNQVPSLDEQALEIIQKSLKQSEEYLTLGQHRQAVQEILWLLESVSTLFQGMTIGDSTIEGKYFNKIAGDLRRLQKGTAFERVMEWATSLHGYLSSPTGGGVRHGTSLKTGVALLENDARLFCNLTRSYISYLLAEHARLSD